VRRIDKNADQLVAALLGIANEHHVCILDSCGVGHLGSHLLLAGADPVDSIEIFHIDALDEFAQFLRQGRPVIFTIAYELGLTLNKIKSRHASEEPLIFAAAFDALSLHDYNTGETSLLGDQKAVDRLEVLLKTSDFSPVSAAIATDLETNFTIDEYISAVLAVKELIRSGDTYQTNLTRKITAKLGNCLTPEGIFWRLRNDHPAPFASFIKRHDTTVISASPERFFRVEDGVISTSPIKGTRPRGKDAVDDARLRDELLRSRKDRAENTMIVDLLRNDLGRVCEFGSVQVERLCEIEQHPTLFHLVSTISGRLRSNTGFADVIRALFPCGSITGAPKISTMEIIDDLERCARGLSMGAIGIYMPVSYGIGEFVDTSVAIRTMTVRGAVAEFNVGGGIVIDSDPRSEYEETVVKSKALLAALGVVDLELSPASGV
jgi:aminodeoxychorismate synthase component I